MLLELRRHESTPCQDVHAIRVQVGRAGSEIALKFQLDGDVQRIFPLPSGASTDRLELWRHTCFEAFIAIEGRKAYEEFNFAPSGEWRAYAFCGYRELDPAEPRLPSQAPKIEVKATHDRLELDIRIPIVPRDLPSAQAESRLRVGLAAVIESQDGTLSYWALRHAPGKPDFHHADGFVLEL